MTEKKLQKSLRIKFISFIFASTKQTNNERGRTIKAPTCNG
jgi:hypothetical protein